jgi:hypothetical protein
MHCVHDPPRRIGYDSARSSSVPARIRHNIGVMSAIRNLHAINSAIEVALIENDPLVKSVGIKVE